MSLMRHGSFFIPQKYVFLLREGCCSFIAYEYSS